MKRKFTFLAALALLVFTMPSLVAWGQTRADVTMQYTGTTTTNMTGNNDAATVGLDATVWSVVGAKGGANNFPGLNKDGTIRLYYHANGSNTITVTSLNNYTISSIAITYNGTYTNGTVSVGGQQISGTNGVYAINSTSFVIGNGNNSNVQVHIKKIVISYSTGSTPTCATPIFTPEGGSFLNSQEVSINCGTEGATIYYTLDGENPTTSSTEYTAPFTVTETTTVKAFAVKADYDDSEVATAVFTKETPMTVAEARDYIDGLNGATSSEDVYVEGIISQIDSYNSTYHSITYWISDDGTTTNQMEVYSGKGLNGADFSAITDLTLGSTVIVKGKVKLYNTTYEFTQNSQIVSLTLPATPYITANDVEITYDTDEDEIEYAINNPVNGGVLTASTESNWLTLGEVGSTIPFYCSVNTAAAARTATVTLTYTYGNNQTATKDVTVTQTGNPNVFDNISDITEVGTAYSVRGTVVATNSRGFIMGDGTGYVYYYKNAAVTQSVGDMVKVSGTTGTYGHIIQFTNTATVEEATSSNYNNTPAATVITEVPDYTNGYHLSTYLEFEGALAKDGSNYLITLGEAQIQISYPTTDQGTALTALNGKTVHVKGYFSGINSSSKFTVMLESVEEVVSTTPVINATTPETLAYNATEGSIAYTIDNPVGGTSLIATTDAGWISNITVGETAVTFNATENEGTEDRTATFTLSYSGAEDVTVTVTQGHFVIDYAELPFEWEGGERSAFEALNGTSTYSVGDYAENQGLYRMKLDGDGDYIQVKCDQQPGKVTIGVKMIGGGNTSTITVQGSADGETFTNIQDLTISGAQNDILTLETTNAFAETDRYVRLYFTKGSNVGVGPITIAVVDYTPSVTITNATVNVLAAGGNGTIEVAYMNIPEEDIDPEAVFFEANGETPATYDWISVTFDEDNNAVYTVDANTGEARTAYFMVHEKSEDIYSNLVAVNQAAAPQQYTLTVEPFENLEIITFVNDEMVLEADGEIQVNDGDHIMLSIVADEGYVMETLMVNGVNHVNDIAEDFTYEFDMPAEAVTISATAIEYVAPTASNYVRITSLDQLTDGSKVIIAARHNATVDSYYAMKNATSGRPEGTLFTSMTSGNDEVVTSTITDDEDNYYWTVNVTENGYTFTNANGAMIGYGTSGTNFVTGGTNTEWTIERSTAGESTMVPGYTGFVIKNKNTDSRAFAFNGSAFGAYATTNMTAAGYNFYLDFFVQSEAPVTETYTLEITGYSNFPNPDGGYYLIASPVTVNPADVEGMTEGSFDLYYFDEAEDNNEWQNWKDNDETGHFNLVPGTGYLYAHQEDGEFELTGTPYTGDGTITLNKTNGTSWSGWNLVGNPFGETAYIQGGDWDFYVMNQDGLDLEPAEVTSIGRMQGIFVVANSDGEQLTLTTEAPTAPQGGKIVVNVRSSRGNNIDRAMIRFGEGRQLPKFQLNPDNTKLYIAQEGEDFAVVRSIDENSTPVSFRAAENGIYTLSVNADNIEMEYLHLIDNMTGNDIDLLATPSYTFEARTTDYADRFNLVYATCDDVNENNMQPFAFFNGSEWVINNAGNALLQVVDVTGRVISSETLNGNAHISLDQVPGVYVMRLVSGNNVKVQKVIIK